MPPPLSPLPIDEVIGEIIERLAGSPALVLCAPPGAGKTTRVPPAIVDAGLAGRGQVLVLQPRRVAARATAARIAAERGGRVGDEVGYRVRFESRVGPATRLAVITEGILLRRLLDDPFLEGVAAVVYDEFHERSLASDLALAMVRQVQQSVRPELKIVVMSATLAAEPLCRYLGDCPAVESRGRMFPVDIRYQASLERTPLADRVAEAVEQLLGETGGDLLVFLPGVGEIRQCEKRLASLALEHNLAVHPLYGDLPAEKQDEALQPGARRKVILATNVAETSLTIEGVTAVVDSGLARVLRYDERTGLDRLELVPISKAAAEQRAGRAGRTQRGICLRLWPEAAHRSRPDYELPEIRRVDLAGAVLQVLSWIEPELSRFPWFEPPPAGAVDRAIDLLQKLGAVDEQRAITPLGRRIAALPVHPRIGRLLVEGQARSVLPSAALAAALLTERDPFVRQPRPEIARREVAAISRSDVLDRVDALQQFEAHTAPGSDVGTLNRSAARHILRTRDQLVRLVGQSAVAPESSGTEEAMLRCLLAAYPDRVARRREKNSRRGLLVGGRGVRLAEDSALADEELYVCVDVDAAAGEALVRQASAVERSWLPAEAVRTDTALAFDEASGKVIARKRVLYYSLVLEESQAALPLGEEVERVLAQAAAQRLEQVFPADAPAIASFRARVMCLTEWMPELELPRLDDAALVSLLPQLAAGRRSLAELQSAPWLAAMKSLFTWPQLQAIDREAPERIEVPSGSRIALKYEPGRPPVLAVRIQELFGLLETPRVAAGRIPVLIHMLAPNMRVAQVTDDLASFWNNTYRLVRKDLRARYPKHAWPEDPFAATAERRPKRRPADGGK